MAFIGEPHNNLLTRIQCVSSFKNWIGLHYICFGLLQKYCNEANNFRFSFQFPMPCNFVLVLCNSGCLYMLCGVAVNALLDIDYTQFFFCDETRRNQNWPRPTSFSASGAIFTIGNQYGFAKVTRIGVARLESSLPIISFFVSLRCGCRATINL